MVHLRVRHFVHDRDAAAVGAMRVHEVEHLRAGTARVAVRVAQYHNYELRPIITCLHE